MNLSIAVPAAVLAPFFAYSSYCVQTAGLFGFVPVVTSSAWGVQIGLDLVIALSIFVGWMVRDARKQEIPAWPFVVLVASLGSIGALAYLLARGVKQARAASTGRGPVYENG